MSINYARESVFPGRAVYGEVQEKLAAAPSNEFAEGSFEEFVKATGIGLGAVLLVSIGTYLVFSGIVTTLVGLAA